MTNQTTAPSLELRALSTEQQTCLERKRPDFTALAEILAHEADAQALVIPFGRDLYLHDVITARTSYDATRAVRVPGAPSQCFRNVAARASLGQCTIATGYALSGGLWQAHTWGLGLDGEILETTEHRDAYFGITPQRRGRGLHRPQPQRMRARRAA